MTEQAPHDKIEYVTETVGVEEARAFAENLARLRKEAGLTQAQLAQRVADKGWPSFRQTTISRIENLEQEVSIGEGLAIASALGTRLASMLNPPLGYQVVRQANSAAANLRNAHRMAVHELMKVEAWRTIFERFVTLAERAEVSRRIPEDEIPVRSLTMQSALDEAQQRSLELIRRGVIEAPIDAPPPEPVAELMIYTLEKRDG